MHIYDLAGRLVLAQEFTLVAGFQNIDLPVADLPQGSYALTVRTPEKTLTANFVKQ